MVASQALHSLHWSIGDDLDADKGQEAEERCEQYVGGR